MDEYFNNFYPKAFSDVDILVCLPKISYFDKRFR